MFGFNSHSFRYFSTMSGPTYSGYDTFRYSGFMEDRRSPWTYKFDGFRFLNSSNGDMTGGKINLYGLKA